MDAASDAPDKNGGGETGKKAKAKKKKGKPEKPPEEVVQFLRSKRKRLKELAAAHDERWAAAKATLEQACEQGNGDKGHGKGGDCWLELDAAEDMGLLRLWP